MHAHFVHLLLAEAGSQLAVLQRAQAQVSSQDYLLYGSETGARQLCQHLMQSGQELWEAGRNRTWRH
jgi:hypothetical protein